MADDDVDMVDSVAGLRQILTNISAADDDDRHDVAAPAADESVNLPVDNQCHWQLSLDNTGQDDHRLDIRSAAVVDSTETDEKLDGTSEMETKCVASNEMTTDGAVTHSEMTDKKTSKEDKCILENERKCGDVDELIAGEKKNTSEMEIKWTGVSDVAEMCTELVDKADADKDDDDDDDDDDDKDDQAVATAAAAADDDKGDDDDDDDDKDDQAATATADDAELLASLAKICADYGDAEEVSK